MRHEAVIPGVTHGRVQEAVDHQGTGFLVHLVLDRLSADRHFDDGVHVFGRILADGNGVEVHGAILNEAAEKLKKKPAALAGPPVLIFSQTVCQSSA